MSWLFGDWVRVLVVLGLVAATTGYVWVKVQMAESARGIESSRDQVQALRVESSRLEAAADLASRPGLVRERAEKELQMIFPEPAATAELFVGVVDD